jgi:hypothetical protein
VNCSAFCVASMSKQESSSVFSSSVTSSIKSSSSRSWSLTESPFTRSAYLDVKTLKIGRLEFKVPERVDRIFAAAESRAERGDHASLAVFADEAVPQDLEEFSQTYSFSKLEGTFVNVEPLNGT